MVEEESVVVVVAVEEEVEDVRCLLVRGSCASGVEPALTPPPRLDVERALLALELALEVEEVDGDARFFERTEVAAAVLFELAVGLTADARAGGLEPGLGLAALELAVFGIALGLAALELTFGSGAPLRLNSYPPVEGCLPRAHAPTDELSKPNFSA